MSIFKRDKKNILQNEDKIVKGVLTTIGVVIAAGIGAIVSTVAKLPNDDKFWDYYENNRK